MKRKSLFFLSALLCLVLFFVLYPTDEKRIIKVVNNAVRAAISRDSDRLMKLVSYNYTDEHGNGYLQTKKIVQKVFRDLSDIEIDKNIIKISIHEDLAEADMSIRVIASRGKERGYVLGDAGMPRTIKIYFERSAYKWLITKVEGAFYRESP